MLGSLEEANNYAIMRRPIAPAVYNQRRPKEMPPPRLIPPPINPSHARNSNVTQQNSVLSGSQHQSNAIQSGSGAIVPMSTQSNDPMKSGHQHQSNANNLASSGIVSTSTQPNDQVLPDPQNYSNSEDSDSENDIEMDPLLAQQNDEITTSAMNMDMEITSTESSADAASDFGDSSQMVNNAEGEDTFAIELDSLATVGNEIVADVMFILFNIT